MRGRGGEEREEPSYRRGEVIETRPKGVRSGRKRGRRFTGDRKGFPGPQENSEILPGWRTSLAAVIKHFF